MPGSARRWVLIFAAAVFVLYSFNTWNSPSLGEGTDKSASVSTSRWRSVANIRYPITHFVPLPKGSPQKLPDVQASFKTPEYDEDKKVRLQRLKSVKDTMVHSWKGYKAHAWLKDEVAPISGTHADKFGGWAATLVDSLDTLWIMDMKKEFDEAVAAVHKIDFSTSVQREVNVFETTIRYLGGFLSAYDLSGQEILLDKALELAEMLMVAFDTVNHMPITRWDWQAGLDGMPQETRGLAVASEVGSLCLEFTRLAQITGEARYYDAIDRISTELDAQQDSTYVPGLWPVWLDTASVNFSRGSDFTIAALTDSMFEYLPKMHALLGGRDPKYQRMYEKALAAMNKHVFFRAIGPENRDILFPADVRAHEANDQYPTIIPHIQHLGCYVGGMVGLGGKLFEHKTDVDVGRKLTDGCIWAYEAAPNGIMPEIFEALRCDEETNPKCEWKEDLWLEAAMNSGASTPEDREGGIEAGRAFANRTRIAPGFVRGIDPRYLLRPEAIESVFVLYRMTGDKKLQDHGWNMFQAVVKATKTKVAHAAVKDVMVHQGEEIELEDSMESFWTAETLKYYYLLFSDPDVVSLDDYVLNTEAHPFRRPTTGGRWARKKGTASQAKWGL